MKYYYYILSCLIFMIVGIQEVSATHIVGGEMNYRCLGNNQYEITLTVYRDCETSNVAFDNLAIINIYDGNNSLVQGLSVALGIDTLLSATLADSCLAAPPTACIRKGTYVTIVTLPTIPQGYTIAYQRCCRNNTIVNIANPGQTGATYFIEITEDAMLGCNNSPVFKDLPNIFLCQHKSFVFDHSVIDVDGDSIVYELCTPYNGASQQNPIANLPPPYTNITWNPPYSTTAMLGTANPLTIDPATGILTGVPVIGGVFLVGVCAKEYRNGVLLSTTVRDFQYKIGSCLRSAVADFDQSFHSCDDLEYQFYNTGNSGVGTFLWDFGGLDTSTQAHPLFTFPSQGIYNITLIAGAGTPCADTMMGTVDVQIQAIEMIITPPQLVCPGDTVKIGVVDINAGITGPSTYTWGPISQILSGQGTDSVTIIATNNQTIFASGINFYNCQNTAITTISTLGNNNTYDTLRPTCNTSLTVDFQNPFSSNPTISDYLWNFDGLGTSTANDPSFTFPDTGKYDVTLYVGATSTTCADTFFVHVDLQLEGLKLEPLPAIDLCKNDSLWLVVNDSLGNYAGPTTYNWTPNATFSAGQGTDSVLIIGQQNGAIKVYVANSHGCLDTLETVLNIENFEASFDSLSLLCNTSLIIPFVNNSTTSSGSNNYLWDFGGIGTSTAVSPTYAFPDTGAYTVTLIAGVGHSCADTATLDVYLPLSGIDLQPLTSLAICNNDSASLKVVDLLDAYSSSTQYVWNSTGSPILSGQGTDSVFLMPGQTSTVSVIATNNHGCSDTVSTTIGVTVVDAAFSALTAPCNTTFDLSFQNTTNTNLGGINYQWDFNGLGTSTITNPTHTFPDTGSYSVTLIAGTGSPCVDTTVLNVQVLLQGVDLQPIPAQAVCNNGTTSMQAIDNNIGYSSSIQYNWTVANGTILSGQGTNTIGIDPNPNNATVSVIATNNYGCKDTVLADIRVDVVQAAFDSLELPCNTSLVIPFVNSTTTNMAGITYQWDFNSLGTSTALNPTYTFPDTGAYTVSLIAGITGQCTDTVTLNVYLPLEGVDLQTIPDQLICEGDVTGFKAIDLLDAYSSSIQYVWSSPVGILSGQGTDSIRISANNTTTVSVIATNNHGCSDTATANLGVLIVDADFELDTVVCNTSLSVNFVNTSFTNPNNNLYEWNFDGLGTTMTIDPTFTFPDTGVYNVSLIAGVGNICPDTLVLPVDLRLDGVVLQPISPLTVCQDDSVKIKVVDVLDAYSSSTQYVWTPAAEIVAGQGTDSILIIPNNNVLLQGIATNNWGCSDTTTVTVDVRIVEATFDSIDLNCKLTLDVPFQNSSFVNTGSTAYAWSFGNLGTSTQTDPTYTFPDTGWYTVQLIADAGLLCPDTFTRQINVQLKGLEITATDALVFCARDTATLVATNLYEGYSDFTNYEWEPANLVLSGQGTDTAMVTIPLNTTFTVTGTNSFGCKDTFETLGAIQYPSPTLSITSSPDSMFVGQTTEITATDDLNYTYYWVADTTLSDTTIYDPIARPRVTTTYYLTVENQYGCQTMDSIAVIIRQPICASPVVFVPNAFTPDGDGYNDVLMVNGNNVRDMTMIIFNRWGQKVFETNDQSIGWDGTFKGKELPPDSYGYYMRCTCELGGELQLRGSILLLR